MPVFTTSESLGRLIRELSRWTGGKTDTLLKRMLAAWLESLDAMDLPESLRAEAEGFLLRTTPPRSWLVYEHRAADGAVVYIGKGRPGRAWSSDRTDPEHSARLRARELQVVLIQLELTEAEALAEERRLIERRLLEGCSLYNRAHRPSETGLGPGV